MNTSEYPLKTLIIHFKFFPYLTFSSFNLYNFFKKPETVLYQIYLKFNLYTCNHVSLIGCLVFYAISAIFQPYTGLNTNTDHYLYAYNKEMCELSCIIYSSSNIVDFFLLNDNLMMLQAYMMF